MNATNDIRYTVGQVADIFQVTVRTLHHWEQAGLLQPAERSWSNYRLYSDADCQRIQHILIYRATGMALADIRVLLDGDSSGIDHLIKQRETLIIQQQELADMIAAIDILMEDTVKKQPMTAHQIGEILRQANFAEYQQEAEDKYASSDDWKVSEERTKEWTANDWLSVRAQFADIDAKLVAAVREGIASDSSAAQKLVEEHRQVLSTFFPVTHAKHFILSRGYIKDERFREYYENQQEDLAQWLADAIAANSQANGVDPAACIWE
ncbi:MerR family transcriptional regulator [Arcanobacterium phocae]|uniref:MerR family transcriptional regulator n=1 Tax=Arcanobacterium phocae TaxID=131112 RepID=UPI001C0F2ED4|nr:MerR family transcriptional regulator [Arcanobacterium phocae]